MSDLDKTMKVLLVDDSPLMRMAMKKILHNIGFENVNEAGGGKEGLEMIAKEQYQLILLDWVMPEMRGIEFLKAAKAIENYKDVPIVVASAENVQGNVDEAKEAGAADYLPKPFTPEALEGTLKAAFGG